MTQPDSFDLDAMFDAARAKPPQMPHDLALRIAADAEALVPAQSLWRRMMAAVGGPAGVGGLVTATVAGFWFGVAPPADTVDPLVVFGAVEVEVASDEYMSDLTGFEWYSEEG